MLTEDKDKNVLEETNIPVKSYFYAHRFFDCFEFKEFVCGCGAAFVNIGVTYPIYKMIFRQMLHGIRIQIAFGQLRHEGITFLYRGVFPPLAQKTISLSIMFGVFDGTRRYLVEDCFINAYAAKVIAGIASGSVEAALLPFERIQALLAHSKFHQSFGNTPLAFRYVIVNHGFAELYRGLIPVLWRNGPSNALFFMLREEANARLPKRSSTSAKAAQEFLSGAVIGSTTSALFYPLNVIKVAMQSDMGHRSESMWSACKRIYDERGSRIAYFYRGCGFNSCRSFLSWGIINAAHDQIRKLFV